jgi:chorismate dehydratase
MIRLGHIDYSNCVPVHAMLLREPPPDIRLVRGVPAELNRALAEGSIDAAPCSSIEFARQGGAWGILPGLAIGSDGPVHSIILDSTRPLAELDDVEVAVPTASATSVVLLRALAELRYGVRPRLRWYAQEAAGDPVAGGAAAALRIGDVALRHTPPEPRLAIDLGAEWSAWTGLPFAFAVWQVAPTLGPAGVARLAGLLHQSRQWFRERQAAEAARYAGVYGLPADRLLAYWSSLRYTLDDRMQQGLLHFYELAARLGEAPPGITLRILDATPSY